MKLDDSVWQALEAYPVLNDSVKLTDPLTEAELQRTRSLFLPILVISSSYD